MLVSPEGNPAQVCVKFREAKALGTGELTLAQAVARIEALELPGTVTAAIATAADLDRAGDEVDRAVRRACDYFYSTSHLSMYRSGNRLVRLLLPFAAPTTVSRSA